MDEWSDDELEAAVVAYLQMLADELSGRVYSKADANAGLREGPLKIRTKGSVEYRMQNISAVLEDLGQIWLPGYKPARNVGLGVKQRLLAILKRHGVQTATTP
jgi:5-methylcytosine-specific restriction protein A